ncbi:hypothetical protein RRG08_017694 [Elysia crispata]|uniref:Uncharacterized protein n=1 Tax=Elysia crispata TaxID=231223 RepID=A0AAE1EEC6_9GAST|nr:hypothetical protein RRG08_017694 [Elysia crispata]
MKASVLILCWSLCAVPAATVDFFTIFPKCASGFVCYLGNRRFIRDDAGTRFCCSSRRDDAKRPKLPVQVCFCQDVVSSPRQSHPQNLERTVEFINTQLLVSSSTTQLCGVTMKASVFILCWSLCAVPAATLDLMAAFPKCTSGYVCYTENRPFIRDYAGERLCCDDAEPPKLPLQFLRPNFDSECRCV